jgi:hypothetical protein
MVSQQNALRINRTGAIKQVVIRWRMEIESKIEYLNQGLTVFNLNPISVIIE